jgi:4-amino-4-deoxy-L-arabinose transferase-like glycosyltransferase
MSDQPPPILSPAVVRRPWLWVALLILYGLALNLVFIGSSPLGSHEALAGERAREMTTLGHWTVPYLDGQPDVRKPPLPFVFTALLAGLAGGFTETVVRAPSALAALGVALLLMFWVRPRFGWRPALLTAFVTLTSAGFIGWGRRGEVDMQVAFWTTATLLSYWLVVTESGFRRRAAFFAIMSLSLAAGVLTKGPLTPATLVVTSLALTFAGDPGRRGWRALWPMIAAGFVSIALVAPWTLTMVRTQPDAWTVWYEQYIGRAAGEIGHDKPWHFYLTRTPLQLWGLWTIFVLLGAYLALRYRQLPRGLTVFLLAWGLGAELLLSFSVGKRIHYALGAQPPFLLLAGWALDRTIFVRPGDWHYRLRHACAWGVVVYAALALIGVSVYTGMFLSKPDPAENQSVVGQLIAREIPATDTVASYRGLGAVELFYARRFIPVIEQNDLAAWRDQHPGGYLIVGVMQIPELWTDHGPWQVISPPDWRPAASKAQAILLRVPPK